jgi:hypothetical protein
MVYVPRVIPALPPGNPASSLALGINEFTPAQPILRSRVCTPPEEPGAFLFRNLVLLNQNKQTLTESPIY